MGTSKDFSGGKGGAWTPFKLAATNYVKHGGRQRAQRVVARHVATLGGVAGALTSGKSAVPTAQRLTALLSGIASSGLDQALRDAGLADVIGKTRFEVVAALIEHFGQPGTDLEQEASRLAALDVIDELFAKAESYEDLANIQLNEEDVVNLLTAFVAAYIFNRLLPAIAEREARLPDPSQGVQLERDLREMIRAHVRVQLADTSPLDVDWQGAEGKRIINETLRSAYAVLESLE